LPLPELPPVIVNHATVLEAVHAHPAGAVTEIAPEAPPLANDAEVGDTAYVHVDADENSNVFDNTLGAIPPGPTAETVASYTTPAGGSAPPSAESSTAIVLLPSGVGLPSENVWKGCNAPTWKNASVYPVTSGVTPSAASAK